MRSMVILMWLGSAAHAQLEDEPTPTVPAVADGIPDATFRAVADRPVVLRTRNGAELHAHILAVAASTVTLALAPSGTVVTLDRSEVIEVRLLPPPEALSPLTANAAVAAAAPPPHERHFAFNLGMAPSLGFDLDYGLSYSFANLSLVLPAATAGGLVAFSLGAGVAFPLAKHSRWKLELFAFVAPTRFSLDSESDEDGGGGNPWTVGFGVGVGVHYTLASGFSFGFKMPLIGYAAGGSGGSVGSYFAAFYLSSVMGLPLASLGYRF